MNTEMKQRIKQLRIEGYGYKNLAKALDLTLSVVRYACYKINQVDPLEGSCEYCGIKPQSIKGKKRKRFCSDICCWDYCNSIKKQ